MDENVSKKNPHILLYPGNDGYAIALTWNSVLAA